MKQLLTGNEAVARGIYEAGVRFAAAYPGTPSTEILENLARFDKNEITAEWSTNEKVALETAIGFSIAGGRAFASMKQVGLNVAADPLFSFAYTGGSGGLLLVSADEPGIHSSQTEQDNRYYAKMAKIPMLEPADSQEAKDMAIAGLDLSEKYRVPVMLRMTTRICHSKSLVTIGERTNHPAQQYSRNINQFTTIPAVSVQLRIKLEEKLKQLTAESEKSPFNFETRNGDKVGIVTSGISYQYALDAFGNEPSYLKLGFTNPLPMNLIRQFASSVKELWVIEEVEPFLEEQLRAVGLKVVGKNVLPNIGELSVNILKEALTGQEAEVIEINPERLAPRPPVLCAGCPHRGIFYSLSKRKDIYISGDIGCYGLGAMPPLSAMDTCICMGHSISGGHGAAKAFDAYGQNLRSVSVIGDSTFFHSGMTGLLNVVYNQSRTVTVILDNRVTGMTGHQEHPGTGLTAQGDPAKEADIPAIVKALGIENIRTVNPLDLNGTKAALDWAFSLDAPSVVICRWPCALKKLSASDAKEFQISRDKYQVEAAKCVGCRKCISTGCPALRFDKKVKKTIVDDSMCLGCAICAQVCPKEAITISVAGGMK